jgi:hypothetical protein
MKVTSRAWFALTMIVTCTFAPQLRGQRWEPVAPGMRVSMRVVDSLSSGDLSRNFVVGNVLNRDDASFYVRVTSSDTLRVAYGSISQLAISQGRSRVRSAVKYAFMEAVLFGLLMPDQHTRENRRLTVAGGAVLGGIIGAIVPDERWHRVKR